MVASKAPCRGTGSRRPCRSRNRSLPFCTQSEPSPAGQPLSLARSPCHTVRQALPSNPIRRSLPVFHEAPATRNPPAPSACGSWKSLRPSWRVPYSTQRKLTGLPPAVHKATPWPPLTRICPLGAAAASLKAPRPVCAASRTLVDRRVAGSYTASQSLSTISNRPGPSALSLGGETGSIPLSSSSGWNSQLCPRSLWSPPTSSVQTPSGIHSRVLGKRSTGMFTSTE